MRLCFAVSGVPQPCRAGIRHRANPQRTLSAKDADFAPQSAIDAARVRLEQDPNTQARLQRIDDAQRRVLELQAAQQQIQADIQAASSGNDGSSSGVRQGELAAAADEVSAAARDFSAARAERDAAQDEQRRMRADLQKEEDRLQSGLAGAVAAAGGLLVQVPLLAGSQHQAAANLATLATVAIASGLFGVIWRYTVRSEEDAADLQLKGGCIAAFGLASGLTQANALLGTAVEAGEALSIQLLAQAALCCGASMLQFAAAAALLEACMTRKLILRTSRLP